MARRTLDETAKVRREFAKRLKSARVLGGYENAKDFADKLGMEEAETYRRWERGETEPNLAALVKIAALLTASSVDMLLGLKPASDPAPARRPFRAVR